MQRDPQLFAPGTATAEFSVAQNARAASHPRAVFPREKCKFWNSVGRFLTILWAAEYTERESMRLVPDQWEMAHHGGIGSPTDGPFRGPKRTSANALHDHSSSSGRRCHPDAGGSYP